MVYSNIEEDHVIYKSILWTLGKLQYLARIKVVFADGVVSNFQFISVPLELKLLVRQFFLMNPLQKI